MIKPKILISKCLGFANCRYDGAMIPFPFIETLKEHVDFVTVCPEEEIGLGTPRPTIRLQREGKTGARLVEPKSGNDYTDSMQSFSKAFVQKNMDIDGAILKSKSPSCGTLGIKIYNAKTGTPTAPGKGMFAHELLKNHPILSVEEEGRLRDYIIREHFLIKLYSITRWNRAKESGKIKALMDYQAEHKYLFMAYNQDAMRKMGKIIANHKEIGFDKVVIDCEPLLDQILKEPISTGNKVNAFLHIFGYFKNDIDSNEKSFFLEQIEKYQNHSIPYHSISALLESWTIKYDKDYLKGQIIFSPFPKELMSIRDSGKGVV